MFIFCYKLKFIGRLFLRRTLQHFVHCGTFSECLVIVFTAPAYFNSTRMRRNDSLIVLPMYGTKIFLELVSRQIISSLQKASMDMQAYWLDIFPAIDIRDVLCKIFLP